MESERGDERRGVERRGVVRSGEERRGGVDVCEWEKQVAKQASKQMMSDTCRQGITWVCDYEDLITVGEMSETASPAWSLYYAVRRLALVSRPTFLALLATRCEQRRVTDWSEVTDYNLYITGQKYRSYSRTWFNKTCDHGRNNRWFRSCTLNRRRSSWFIKRKLLDLGPREDRRRRLPWRDLVGLQPKMQYEGGHESERRRRDHRT